LRFCLVGNFIMNAAAKLSTVPEPNPAITKATQKAGKGIGVAMSV
jgi:hypothetical protein